MTSYILMVCNGALMVDCVKDGHWFTHHPLANGLGLILLLAVSAHPSLPLCRSLPSLSVPSLMSSLCQCYRLRNKDNRVLLKYSVTILIMTQLLLQHGTHTTVGAMLHGADSRRKQLGSHSLTLSPGRVWHGHRGARGAVAPAAPWRRAHGLPSSRRLGPAPGVLPLVWPPHHGHGVLLGHRLYRPAVERQNKDEKMLFFFFLWIQVHRRQSLEHLEDGIHFMEGDQQVEQESIQREASLQSHCQPSH